jgi:hypothetical protein
MRHRRRNALVLRLPSLRVRKCKSMRLKLRRNLVATAVHSLPSLQRLSRVLGEVNNKEGKGRKQKENKWTTYVVSHIYHLFGTMALPSLGPMSIRQLRHRVVREALGQLEKGHSLHLGCVTIAISSNNSKRDKEMKEKRQKNTKIK